MSSTHDMDILLVTLAIGAVFSLVGAIQERKNPMRMTGMLLMAVLTGLFPMWIFCLKYML